LEIALVLGILVVAVLLFVTERVRVDVVALMVLATLGLTGVITPAEAVSGFANPAVVTVWAVFILSGGLSRTGVAGILGRQVLRLAGSSEARLVFVIMMTSAFMSAFMNNVGVAALLLPVVMDIARRTGRAPSRLLMPLAFSSLLGGLMTQIGTPPNILVTAALEENGLEPFKMFDFAPAGGAVVVAGILYMTFVGRRLLPKRDPAREMAGEAVDLEEVYSLHDRLFMVDVPDGSPLAGRSLAESRVGSALALNVMGIVRNKRLELAPDPSTRFEPGDRLLVQGQRSALSELDVPQYLTLESERLRPEELVSGEVGFVEAALAPGSKLAGKTLRELDFRNRYYGALVLAAWRDGAPIRTHLAETELHADDVLLVHGERDKLDRLAQGSDFVVAPADQLGRYRLEERLMSISVPAESPVAGKTLTESRLGDVFSLGVMGIVRDGRKMLIPDPDEVLRAGDTLLVKGQKEELALLEGLHEMPVETDIEPELSDLESESVGLAEIVLAPRSTVAGKTLPAIHFREKYGLNVVAVMRAGKQIRDLRYLPLELGDALLLYGPREKLKLVGLDPDFLVLTEEAQEPPLLARAPLAALIMASVVGSVILGLAPIFIAGVTGAILMVLTRCLSMDEAYRAIEWRAVFLIAGMLPLGLALEKSGAAEMVTSGVVGLIGGLGPLFVVAGLYLLTAFAAQVMPTAAVAILVAPLAINTAAELGMSPYALMMTVSLSASASFMSPVAHPANVLVMGPGGYRFVDYIKVGLPLTLICLLVTLLVLPVFWPLAP
jgi:di/tricarboxylate transporter